MQALLVTPRARSALTGNRVTAERWVGILGELGWSAAIDLEYTGQSCDLLVALHARKSAESVRRFREERPGTPLVVALTGTDLYGDLRSDEASRRSLELASRLVVLQPLGIEAVPEPLRGKARSILQSVERVEPLDPPRADRFEVSVLGHLRGVKDPFRAAEAARLLPPTSRLHVLQIGAALEPEMAARARREEQSNPRYTWLGELPRLEALRVLGRTGLLVLTSVMEGGANAVAEALVHDVPVVSSRIPGSVGMLGEDHPGYFPVGDTEALAALMHRAETDAKFYAELRDRARRLAPSFAREREQEAWRALLGELGLG